MTEMLIFSSFEEMPRTTRKYLSLPRGGLTVEAERPYAKRGTATMNDKQSEELQLQPAAAITEKPAVKQEKQSEVENPKVQEFVKNMRSLQAELEDDDLGENELKEKYRKLQQELAKVKKHSSPKMFLRALLTAKPFEVRLQERLSAKSVSKDELKKIKEEETQKETKGKLITEPDETQKRVLRHAWERLMSPEEMKHATTRQAIEDAVEAGYSPSDEADSVAQRLLSRAERVSKNTQLSDEERKQQAWDELIEAREEAAAKERNETYVAKEVIPEEREAQIKAILQEDEPEPLSEEKLAEKRRTKEEAIIKAHEVGEKDEQKGVYNYSFEDIREKYTNLQQAGFSSTDIRTLMETGIAGRGAPGGVQGPETNISEDWKHESLTTSYVQTEAEKAREWAIQKAADEERARKGEKIDLEFNPDEDPIDTNKREADRARDALKNKIDAIQEQDRLRSFTAPGGPLQNRIRYVAEQMAQLNKDIPRDTFVQNQLNRFTSEFQRIEDALNSPGGMDAAKSVAKGVAEAINSLENNHYDKLRRLQNENRERRRGNDIRSIEDVARYIMDTDPEEWATEEYVRMTGREIPRGKGRFPLLDLKEVKGEMKWVINEANFMRWVRNRIVRYHNLDPDTPVNFGSAIGIESPDLFRQINLIGMINNPGTYFSSVDGKARNELRDEIERTLWLVGQARNMDVTYRQDMSSDKSFANMLSGVFKPNTFGKEYGGVNNLAALMTTNAEFSTDKNKQDRKIGHATRSAYLMYYHMTDKNKLAELFPRDFALYDKKTMLDSIKVVMKGYGREPKNDEEVKLFIKDAKLDKIMALYDDGTGKIQNDKINAFLGALNVFNPPTKNRLNVAVGRELVKRTAALQAGLLYEKEDIANGKTNDIQSMDFAEMQAFFMTYWSGAASRQDVTFTALNAFTKTEHFQGYLNKQAHPSRAGGIGNPHEFTLAKKLTADPMQGILTSDGKPTIQILEQMQQIFNKNESEEEKRKEESEIVRGWYYDDRAWTQYPTQHVANAFKEFDDRTSGKEIRLDKFAHWDKDHKAIVYDAHDMIDAVQEGLIKPTRYRWSTHKLPYGYENDVLVGTEGDEVVYKKQTLAEQMFGPQVLKVAEQMFKNEIKEAKNWPPIVDSHGHFIRNEENHELLEFSKEMVNHKEFGRIVTKAYLACKFGAMLSAHNNPKHGDEPYLPFYVRENILEALGKIPAGIHGDEHDLQHTHIYKYYFSQFDLEQIRKVGGNTFWKSMWQETRREIRRGFWEGFKKGLVKTLQGAFK